MATYTRDDALAELAAAISAVHDRREGGPSGPNDALHEAIEDALRSVYHAIATPPTAPHAEESAPSFPRAAPAVSAPPLNSRFAT